MDSNTNPTILVVEDDEMQRSLVSMLLEEKDMNVIECESAEAAVNVLNEHGSRISMMFTDINLAGTMDGVELTNIAMRKFPHMTVVVTTGNGVPQLPPGAMFMPKPWNAGDLLREAEKSIQ